MSSASARRGSAPRASRRVLQPLPQDLQRPRAAAGRAGRPRCPAPRPPARSRPGAVPRRRGTGTGSAASPRACRRARCSRDVPGHPRARPRSLGLAGARAGRRQPARRRVAAAAPAKPASSGLGSSSRSCARAGTESTSSPLARRQLASSACAWARRAGGARGRHARGELRGQRQERVRMHRLRQHLRGQARHPDAVVEHHRVGERG